MCIGPHTPPINMELLFYTKTEALTKQPIIACLTTGDHVRNIIQVTVQS